MSKQSTEKSEINNKLVALHSAKRKAPADQLQLTNTLYVSYFQENYATKALALRQHLHAIVLSWFDELNDLLPKDVPFDECVPVPGGELPEFLSNCTREQKLKFHALGAMYLDMISDSRKQSFNKPAIKQYLEGLESKNGTCYPKSSPPGDLAAFFLLKENNTSLVFKPRVIERKNPTKKALAADRMLQAAYEDPDNLQVRMNTYYLEHAQVPDSGNPAKSDYSLYFGEGHWEPEEGSSIIMGDGLCFESTLLYNAYGNDQDLLAMARKKVNSLQAAERLAAAQRLQQEQEAAAPEQPVDNDTDVPEMEALPKALVQVMQGVKEAQRALAAEQLAAETARVAAERKAAERLAARVGAARQRPPPRVVAVANPAQRLQQAREAEAPQPVDDNDVLLEIGALPDGAATQESKAETAAPSSRHPSRDDAVTFTDPLRAVDPPHTASVPADFATRARANSDRSVSSAGSHVVALTGGVDLPRRASPFSHHNLSELPGSVPPPRSRNRVDSGLSVSSEHSLSRASSFSSARAGRSLSRASFDSSARSRSRHSSPISPCFTDVWKRYGILAGSATALSSGPRVPDLCAPAACAA